MLETRVQVRLEAELHDDGEMVAVDVRVHAVQPLEHLRDGRAELPREADAEPRGEDVGVVDVGLAPRHQVLDVVGRGHLRGPLVLRRRRVLPEVLVLVRGLHFRAGGRGAELRDGAVEEVELVVEVDDCGGA